MRKQFVNYIESVCKVHLNPSLRAFSRKSTCGTSIAKQSFHHQKIGFIEPHLVLVTSFGNTCSAGYFTEKHQIRNNGSIYRLYIFLLLLLALPLASQAQVYPEAYLEEAIENNPGLRSQHYAYEAAVERIPLASSLPDPVLSGGLYIPSMSRLMGDQWFEVGVMQMLPWPGTLQKQEAVGVKFAESSYQQYRQNRNQLYMEITRLWLRIYEIDQQQMIVSDYVEIITAREDLIHARYGGGLQRSGLALDIYRLEIQLLELENRLDKLADNRASLVKSFNILVGREEHLDVDIPTTLPEPEEPDIESASDNLLFTGNPQINMLDARAEAANLQKEVERLKTRPTLGLGLQYSYFAPGNINMGQMDGGHMLMPMVSVSLPIYRSKNQAQTQQSQMLAEQARYSIMDQSNTLQTEWILLEVALENLFRDRNFLLQQRDITYKAWELVLAAYTGGSEGFDELLRIQNQLLDLEWRLLETNVNHHLKRAEMDMLVARNIFE